MRTFVVGDIHGRCAQLLNLLDMLPRDAQKDTLVFLGDLIDRGADAPGCVDHIMKLRRENPERVICLRGNHEQMLLDFVDGQATIWLTPVTGGERTFQQYTGRAVRVHSEQDLEEMRRVFAESFPREHLEFMQSLPFYYEDDHAIYVHAGLDEGKHPRESSPMSLLWMRDMDFYKNYRGKPCVFGHTPTPLLPLRGRLGRHGIYISHSAVGLDSGYNYQSPLSCLSLPDFNLFQTFADGREETHQITSFIPDTLREMQRRAGLVS
ncbi:MAG: serine/threonine protein phosphatase [Acidobacteria bacterium]|nr:serine/threonine protein phosphatase [Acidobacteriota bacterium]MCA1627526.1 serine/threonine protein phosphatase [Acidobacteriota bacterium]